MAVVNRCRPTNLSTNSWCLKTMFSEGEGADLIFLPVAVWGQLKQRWFGLESATGEAMVLVEQADTTQIGYIYTEPTTDPESALFPDTEAEKQGLYFVGNNLIFNPTIGNSTEANGVPYQNSSFSLPIGSNRAYDALAQYLQANAWVGIKLSADASAMHIYGGPRGYFPKADEIAEMLFSGNNDAKGETSVMFTVDKANYAIEYITLPTTATNKEALIALMGYIKTGACKENGEEVNP